MNIDTNNQATFPSVSDLLIGAGVIYSLFFVLGVLQLVVYLAALAMLTESGVALFISSTRAGKRVAHLYKSLPRSRRKLNIALWFSLVAFMVFQFLPFISGFSLSGIQTGVPSRYTRQAEDVIWGFSGGIDHMIAGIISIIMPIVISLGFALTLSYALLMFLFMATLRPVSSLLLKRIFYIAALALATVAPLGIAPTPIWYGLPDFSFASSQLDLFNLLGPFLFLLLFALVWLYSQRARLAALGARVKGRVRWIALGGVALQVFYLVVWSVFSAPNLSADAEFFYVGSVLLAAFVAVAWLGLLLMVGARRKWDWALFGLVGATQIASLIVVYPGFLTA